MNFIEWLDTFISEKEIDLEQEFEVEGASGPNWMSYGVVVEHIKIAPEREQRAIKFRIVAIDFRNGDVLHYFRHLAKAIAV